MFGSAEVIIIKHVVKPLLKPCYLFVDRAVKTSTPVFAEVFRDRRQNNNVRRGVKADKEPALINITSSQRWGGESFLQYGCSKSTESEILSLSSKLCGVTKKRHGYNIAIQVKSLNQHGAIPIGSMLIQRFDQNRNIVAVSIFFDTA